MLKGFTSNKALVALFTTVAAVQLPDDAPQWAKFIVLAAGYALTWLIPNKDEPAPVEGKHEAD